MERECGCVCVWEREKECKWVYVCVCAQHEKKLPPTFRHEWSKRKEDPGTLLFTPHSLCTCLPTAWPHHFPSLGVTVSLTSFRAVVTGHLKWLFPWPPLLNLQSPTNTHTLTDLNVFYSTYHYVFYYLFCWPPQTTPSLDGNSTRAGTLIHLFILHPQCPEQGLTHSRYSVSMQSVVSRWS